MKHAELFFGKSAHVYHIRGVNKHLVARALMSDPKLMNFRSSHWIIAIISTPLVPYTSGVDLYGNILGMDSDVNKPMNSHLLLKARQNQLKLVRTQKTLNCSRPPPVDPIVHRLEYRFRIFTNLL